MVKVFADTPPSFMKS